jgi:D-hydroxyproline dehydrogenase subunit gamma
LITLRINNRNVSVEDGTTVAAAILGAGETAFRRSVTGASRGPLCGMGVCFECRVTVDGMPHQRSCLTPVREGMEVVTGD